MAEDKIIHEKTWDKEEYIKNKFSNRPIGFYIEKTKLFLDISLYIIAITFILASVNTYTVLMLPKKTSYYMSSLDGKLYKNTLNDEKRSKLIKAITTIKQERQNSEKK